MPYARPPLKDLAAEAETDLAARLGAADRPRRNVVTVLARVWAGLAHGLYGYIDWLSRQMMPYTATDDYLEKHAAWWGIFRKPAAASQGRAEFTGTAGAKVEAGILLLGPSDQKFQVSAPGELAAGGEGSEPSVILPIRAVLGGPAGDLPAGAALSLISPQSGVKSQARVAAGGPGNAGLTGGAAIESDKDLRARFLSRVQEPPQGGTQNDYKQWALAVPGVTRAWAYGNMFGPGTVGVTVVNDGAASIIPSAELIADVQAYLEDPIRKPVTADVIVFPPTPVPSPIEISGVTPDTARVKAAIAAELAALFAREAAPGGRILISHIREAISVAAGEWDHALVSPLENLQAAPTELLTLGEISFV